MLNDPSARGVPLDRGVRPDHRGLALFITFLLCALALCTYQLFFCEYKSDQVAAIEHGQETLRLGFSITHGIPSGAGFNNPPMFMWLMGALTRFSSDPFALTCVFYLIHCIAILLTARFFWVALPRTCALIAMSFLAFWPSSAMYSNIILAQSLLPLLMIGFYWQLFFFVTRKKSLHFAAASLLAVLASQFHLSGFFLYPLILILGLLFRKHIRWQHIILTGAITLAVMSPFLYHLFAEKHLPQVLAVTQKISKIHWKVFREHVRFCSFDYFRYYFFYTDFNAVLQKSVGALWLIAYPASCLLMALFPAGFVWYIYRLIRAKSIFTAGQFSSKEFPFAVQLAGFLITGVTLGYLIAHAPTPPHYFLVLFPSHIILCAWIAQKLWRARIARALLILAIGSTAVLLAGTFRFLKHAGGHPHEYYLSYALTQKIRHEVWQRLPAQSCPEVTVTPDNYTYQLVLSREIRRNWRCPPGALQVPVRIQLRWDPVALQFRHHITITENP